MTMGPLKKIYFDMDVGDYFNNSPTPDELQCLKKFFMAIKRNSVDVLYHQITDGLYLIYICSHIVTLSINTNGDAQVLDIAPSIFGEL